MDFYRKIGKPFSDFIISLTIILILSPLLITIFILLFIVNSGSPLFIQYRPGKNGLIFRIFKFKTMNDLMDEQGKLLPDVLRITPVGRFIRKTSLDELPQFFCVLKGDMSIVGPRPLLARYLPHYSEEDKRRHSVKPGLTGLAQVKGRNSLSWEDKFRFDLWYVDHLSFTLDLEILYLTILQTLKSKDINSDAFHTAKSFDEYLKARKGDDKV